MQNFVRPGTIQKTPIDAELNEESNGISFNTMKARLKT